MNSGEEPLTGIPVAYRLLAVVILVAAFPAGAQPTAVERTVELVLATSADQARVVGRLMRTGFFVGQLLIP